MTVAHALEQLMANNELTCGVNPVGIGGLRALDGRAFPLQRVKVRSNIAGPCARTVIEQHFSNPFAETLDVTWIFPLPADGALIALELRASDIVVIGECKKREEALREFEQARTEGKRSALVETEQQSVHTLSLAALPPKSDVTIHLTIVELLPVTDSRFRWQFPTTIAPRFAPGTETGHSGSGAFPDTDLVPNASRLTPPIRLSGGTVLDLEVEIAGPLTALESSLHAVKMSLESGVVRVAPSANSTLNRDFILEFATAESSALTTRAYTDGQYTVAIVEAPSDDTTRAIARDAVFVVDISGSMEGVKLDAAKAALKGALHGLQRDDRFQLLAFDDRVERFNSEFVEYNDRNLQLADNWIANLQSRGGTEMLQPIQESLAGETSPDRLRTVLFITDGQSNDEARLLPAVANRRGNAVFFTLGIDTAVNASLLKLLAKAGGGACELCAPTDNIDAVVAKLETRFGSPLLSNLQTTGAARPDGQAVFSGRPATVIIEGAPENVSITATSRSGAFAVTAVPEHINFSLGALWARERVSYLEERVTLRPFEEEAIKPEIKRIALAHKIASKYTSFICVDHSVRSHGERRHVIQPTELPAEWQGAFGGAPAPAMLFAPAGRPMPCPARPRMILPFPVADLPSPAQRQAMKDLHAGFKSPIARAAESGAPGNESSLLAKIAEFVPDFMRKADKKGAPAAQTLDTAGELARTQNANGSYGDDVGRSAAALLALLLLGSTRKNGDRRRTVKKLAEWLAQNDTSRMAAIALNALHVAETTGVKIELATWTLLIDQGTEGGVLASLIANAPAAAAP